MKRIVLITLALGLVSVGLWFGLRSRSEAAESYRVVTVSRGTVEKTISSTGTLEPMVTVQVGTQVSGQLSEILVDYNDRVTEGQVLARIDPSTLSTAVTQAQISLRKATADLADRDREAKRLTGLYEQSLASEADYSSAQYQLEVAKASKAAAEIDLERAKTNLEYATIRAPISGIVVERSVDVGQTVAASLSAPQLFVLAADLSQMRILASVDESDVGQIEEGQKVRFTVQAYPNDEFDGVVRQVRLQSTLQDNVVSYTVVVDVENSDSKVMLLPGMTATVEFLVQTADDVLTLANAGLRYKPSDELMARATENTRKAREASGGSDGPPAPARSEGSTGERRSGQSMASVIYLAANGEPRLAPVRTGITDGQNTVIESPVLEEGTSVIAGTQSSSSAQSSAVSSPFNQNSSSGRRMGPPPPGGF